MKTCLILALLLSMAANACLLAGCSSVSACRLQTPPPVASDDMAEISKGLTDGQRDSLLKGQRWLGDAQGKIVILLDDTEEIRNAKTLLIRFRDGN